MSVSTITFNPPTVTGGNSSTGTVTLTGPAPPGGLAVTLSSNQGIAQVPGTVAVSEGRTSTTFTVTTSSVAAQMVVTVTANPGNRQATLTVNPLSPTTRTLSVMSQGPASGVTITVNPVDNNGNGDGPTPFTRKYNNNALVNLTATAIAPGGNSFNHWQLNGAYLSSNPAISVTMDTDRALTAVYAPIATRGLEIESQNPTSGVPITLSPSDLHGLGNGVTPFSRGYNYNTVVSLTAPTTAPGGNTFQKWLQDGMEVGTSSTINVTMNADHRLTLTAVYVPSAPTITTGSILPGGTVAKPYNQALVAAGGMQPHVWTPLDPLPAGLSLSSGGTLSGTPTTAGVFWFRVQVTGGDGRSSQKNLSLTINEAIPVIGDFVWVGKRSAPEWGEVGASAVSRERIYVMGVILGRGTFLLNLEYDPAIDSWTRKADLPNGVTEGGAATLNDKIYVVGGPVDYRVQIYDPATDTWSLGAALPTPRRGVALAAAGGKIFAIGGVDDTWRDTVEEYDPTTDTWTSRHSMPTPRGYAAIAVVNEKIYVIGGQNTSYSRETVEIYDPAADTWTTGALMPTRRFGAVAAVLNDRIYVIGGRGTFDYLTTVEEYQPGADEWTAWTTKKPISTPRAIIGGGVVHYKIYVVGGKNDTETLASVEEGTLTHVPFSLAVYPAPVNGRVMGTGIDCGTGTTGDCEETLPSEATTTLTAIAGSGYKLGSWTGCQGINGDQCTVEMKQARTVTVTFAPLNPIQPPVSFAPPTEFANGSGPYAIALGDLRGNGKRDIVIARPAGFVSVLFGDGIGGFGPKTDYQVGSTPVSVAIGDLRATGNLDIVAANAGSNSVSVLLNDGTGHFGPKTDYQVGFTPFAVALGDVNGDGKRDLVAANRDSNTISVLLNDGTGHFGPKTDYQTGSGTAPESVALGDLRGTGKLDLVVANGGYGAKSISVFFNDGTGHFGSKTDYTTGDGPWSVALGDLNGDGKPDAVTANVYSQSVSVLLNDGTGHFGTTTDYPIGVAPRGVALGDLNGDGKLDLAIAKGAGNAVSVFLGTGIGTFEPMTDFPANGFTLALALGDLSSDGKLDIAAAVVSGGVPVFLNTTPSVADLAITATDSPDPVPVGNTLAYLLTVRNNGPSAATGVTVTDILPGGVVLISATPSQGSCSVTSVVTCALGALANGGSGTVTLLVTPTTVGTLSNSASVTGNDADPNPSNNTATITTTVNMQWFALTVTKIGTGSGRITSNPMGIDCGPTCSAPFAYGTSVTLTATPATGSTFTGWSGDCAGTGSCTVSMTQARSVTATFTLQTFPLSVTKAGTGSGTVTSTPPGIDCGATCTASFPHGTTVTLTASPAAGSTFTGWSGDCTGTGACTVSIILARSVTATFTLQRFTLSVTRTGTGSGIVTSDPPGIDCGATCSASFDYGTTLSLTATPAPGSSFTGWSGEGCSGTGTCTVSMTQARNVTATFTLQTFMLTLTKTGTGNGTVTSTPAGIDCGTTCSAAFDYGTSVTLTATPATGSTFTGWTGDCTGTGTCTVTMTQARNVTAVFTLQSFVLTVTKAGTGGGSITSSPSGLTCSGATCTGTFDYRTSVTLTANPTTGSTFIGWSGEACSGTGPCTVTMSQDRSVTATFMAVNPTIGLTLNQTSFRPGETLVLNATVTPGATPVVADVYVAVQLPDGTLLFLLGDGSISPVLQPIVQSWPVSSFTGQIFQYTFSGGEPTGNYAWLAAFTQPGTLNFIGSIFSVPFSFGR